MLKSNSFGQGWLNKEAFLMSYKGCTHTNLQVNFPVATCCIISNTRAAWRFIILKGGGNKRQLSAAHFILASDTLCRLNTAYLCLGTLIPKAKLMPMLHIIYEQANDSKPEFVCVYTIL